MFDVLILRLRVLFLSILPMGMNYHEGILRVSVGVNILSLRQF